MRPILASLCLVVLAVPAVAAPADRTARQNMRVASEGIAAAIGAPLKTPKQQFLGEAAPKTDDPCRDDRFCEAYAADYIQVQASVWDVRAMTSTRVAPQLYRSACAGILAGLGEGDVHPELASEAVAQAFQMAAVQGRFEAEIAGVEMTVKPDLGGALLECSFWRRW